MGTLLFKYPFLPIHNSNGDDNSVIFDTISSGPKIAPTQWTTRVSRRIPARLTMLNDPEDQGPLPSRDDVWRTVSKASLRGSE